MTTIQIAIVHHKYGTNVYAGMTDAGVTSQVAQYCREWWDDEHPDKDMPGNDNEVINAYFDSLENEYVEFTSTELVGFESKVTS